MRIAEPRISITRIAIGVLVVFLAVAILQQGLSSRTAAGEAEQRDIVFATVGGIDLKLDLYLPGADAPRPYPLIIYIHGGGWQVGDRGSDPAINYVLTLRAQGFAVASVDYRLAPGSVFPAQIEDVKAAVRDFFVEHLR